MQEGRGVLQCNGTVLLPKRKPHQANTQIPCQLHGHRTFLLFSPHVHIPADTSIALHCVEELL